MVERICSACQHGNPPNDRYCGKCGTPLERQLPARVGDGRLVIAGRQLPVTWNQFGRTVALSAAAVAAEVGLAWLRRRIEAGPAAAAPQQITRVAPAAPEAEQPTALARAGKSVVIESQRVVDVWQNHEGHQRVVERTFWRRTEE